MLRLESIQDCSPLHRKSVWGLLPDNLKAKIREWTLERVSLLGIHELIWKEWLPDDGGTTDLSLLRSYGETCQVESFWEHHLIVEKKIILSWCLRSNLGILGCLMLAWDHLLSLKIQQVHWSLEERGKEHLNVSKEIQQPETRQLSLT